MNLLRPKGWTETFLSYLAAGIFCGLLGGLGSACSIDFTDLTTTGPSGGGSVVPAAPSTAVTSIELFPSFLRATNGEEFRATVVTKIGAVEVLAAFSAAIEGDQIVQILAPIGSSTEQREVIMKARGVGKTTLVVRSGQAQQSAEITVNPATP